MPTGILENLAVFAVCALLSLYVSPKLLLIFFWELPLTIRYVIRKRMDFRAILYLLREEAELIAAVAVLLGLLFFWDQEMLFALWSSIPAFAAWGLGLLRFLYEIGFEREHLIDQYYDKFYLENIHEEERTLFSQMMEHIGEISREEGERLLQQQDLPYAMKKALRNRIKE